MNPLFTVKQALAILKKDDLFYLERHSKNGDIERWQCVITEPGEKRATYFNERTQQPGQLHFLMTKYLIAIP